jgi:hypothetical protein
MILPILGRIVATFYAVAPFVAIVTAFIHPPLALTIFMVWIISAGSVVAIALLCVSLVHIWGDH